MFINVQWSNIVRNSSPSRHLYLSAEVDPRSGIQERGEEVLREEACRAPACPSPDRLNQSRPHLPSYRPHGKIFPLTQETRVDLQAFFLWGVPANSSYVQQAGSPQRHRPPNSNSTPPTQKRTDGDVIEATLAYQHYRWSPPFPAFIATPVLGGAKQDGPIQRAPLSRPTAGQRFLNSDLSKRYELGQAKGRDHYISTTKSSSPLWARSYLQGI
jgi:hypothetical protein